MKTPTRPPSCDQLPTKPGPYYWRWKDGDEWEIHTVFIDDELNNILLCQIDDIWYATENWGGQWLPIPTADELVELQAKAKSYDNGREQWQIWDPCHSKLEMVGRTENEAITAFRNSIQSNNPPEPWSQYLAAGYTCRKVRVCKEVES